MSVTVEEVLAAVAAIRESQNDPEKAHSLEDKLHHAVLRSIATDPSNASALAQAALTTEALDFERWCA